MSKEPKRNVYVGHRYVPKVMGEWDKTESYEGLSIVTNEGTSYTSKKRVPVGIDIKNEEYWVVTGNYNAQIEEYRKDVREMEKEVGKKSDQSYVDNLNEKVTTQLGQMVTNVKTFGAKGDGVTDDTNAIQEAIDFTHDLGGGTVLIPVGTYLIKSYIEEDLDSLINLPAIYAIVALFESFIIFLLSYFLALFLNALAATDFCVLEVFELLS